MSTIKISKKRIYNLHELFKNKENADEIKNLIVDAERCITIAHDLKACGLDPMEDYSGCEDEQYIESDMIREYCSLLDRLYWYNDRFFCRIEYPNLVFNRDVILNYVTFEDLYSKDLDNDFKKKIASGVTKDKRVEKIVVEKIMERIPNILYKYQYKVKSDDIYRAYKVDCYLPEYKIAIEIDEWDHCMYNSNSEKRRQSEIEKALGCTFVRCNPYEHGFSIDLIVSEIIELINKKVESKNFIKLKTIDDLNVPKMEFKAIRLEDISEDTLKQLNVIEYLTGESTETVLANIVGSYYEKFKKVNPKPCKFAEDLIEDIKVCSVFENRDKSVVSI